MKLHMSLRKRLALCAALGLGAMYVLTAILICSKANEKVPLQWPSSNAPSSKDSPINRTTHTERPISFFGPSKLQPVN